MRTSSAAILRSIMNEAGRQSDFYTKRGEFFLATFWGELESLAYDAKQRGHTLLIETRDVSLNPIPIKGCEQQEQPSNLLNIKE